MVEQKLILFGERTKVLVFCFSRRMMAVILLADSNVFSLKGGKSCLKMNDSPEFAEGEMRRRRLMLTFL